MKKKLISIFMIILIMIIISCGSSIESKIVGTWEFNEDNVKHNITFNNDKTFFSELKNEDVITKSEGTWSINGNNLSLNIKDNESETFSFSLENSKLTMTSLRYNNTRVFQKQ
jgi:hypothetical protein